MVCVSRCTTSLQAIPGMVNLTASIVLISVIPEIGHDRGLFVSSVRHRSSVINIVVDIKLSTFRAGLDDKKRNKTKQKVKNLVNDK